MKKLFATGMACLMAVSMCACSGSGEKNSYNIGIVQLVQHPALDAATEGFQDACKEKFGEDNVTFDVQNAQGEQTTCTTINNSFVSSDVDLILANATMSLQTAAQATGDIPILGTSITDYATALGIDDWTGTTGVNVSGTSDLAPIDQQEEYAVNGGEAMNIIFKNDGSKEDHYCVIKVTLMVNNKSENYKEMITNQGLSKKQSIITDEINTIISSKTMSEFKADQAAVKSEILSQLQEYFGADFIIDVMFTSVMTQ